MYYSIIGIVERESEAQLMLMFVVLGFVLTLHEARAQTSRAGHVCVVYLLLTVVQSW